MPSVTARRPATGRRGFTLIEIMVATALVGIVSAGILTVVVRQQRFYASASELIEVRDNLRTVAAVLPTELRSVAPREGDLEPKLGTTLADSAIEYRATLGTSVLCARPTASEIIVPPYGANGDAGLTSWVSPPAVGDSLWIFKPGDVTASPVVPDSMIPYRITAITSGTCPTATGFTANSTEAAAGVRYTLNTNLRNASQMPVGMPIRFLRRVRYSIYLSATDNRWYLGFRDHNPARASPWSAIQPVAGPLLPYATSGPSGLSIAYFDSAGTVLTAVADADRVRRVHFTIRAETETPVRTAGLSNTVNAPIRDSLRISVALRNY